MFNVIIKPYLRGQKNCSMSLSILTSEEDETEEAEDIEVPKALGKCDLSASLAISL